VWFLSKKKKRLVVLASGNGSNLQAIIDGCDNKILYAEVVAVISDRPSAFALTRAQTHRIPTIYHPWAPYEKCNQTRQVYDAELSSRIIEYEPDYIILAGWMRLLTMSFLKHFPMKVINLHPALPGSFPGTHAIEKAYYAFQQNKIKYTGVMVHFVPDEGIDNGPVIAQEIVPIRSNDTLEKLEERIHEMEHHLLINALKQVFQQ
jgi:formyltetrahydrofolate-dependent phosphoribosylglycinamide formyltransferase